MRALGLFAALVVALLAPLVPAVAAATLAPAAAYQGDARSVALTAPDIGVGWQLNDEGYRPQVQDEHGISFNNYFAAFIPGNDPANNPDGLVRVSSIVSVFKGEDDARSFYQGHGLARLQDWTGLPSPDVGDESAAVQTTIESLSIVALYARLGNVTVYVDVVGPTDHVGVQTAANLAHVVAERVRTAA